MTVGEGNSARRVMLCVFDNVIEPPHLNWSSAMFRKRRTDNDEQTTEAGRDYHEVEASEVLMGQGMAV